MPMDLDKPVVSPEQTLHDLLERTARSVERLVELQTPGTHGIEGTEVIPELRVWQLYMPPDVWTPIPANRRRKRLMILQAMHGGGKPSVTATAVAIATSDTRHIDLKDQSVFNLNPSLPHIFTTTNTLYVRGVKNVADPIEWSAGSYILIAEESL